MKAYIPTRGLVHSRTIESVLNNNLEIVFAHSLPVPDAYNYLVDRFLETDDNYALFLDDDILLPEGRAFEMLSANADVAFCDYPLESGRATQYDDKSNFLFSGMGCVLIHRKVFDDIRFRTDVGYSFPDMKPIKRNPDKHGGQDVDFYQQCKQKGYNIVRVGEVGHLRSNLHVKGNNTQLEVREL